MKGRQTKRDRPVGATSLKKQQRYSLRGACAFFGFRKHATAVKRIVNNLTHCRSLWINVHSVARFQMSDDTLGSYLERQAIKLRKTTCLDVIDSHKPLI
jgi:hypothetical protein